MYFAPPSPFIPWESRLAVLIGDMHAVRPRMKRAKDAGSTPVAWSVYARLSDSPSRGRRLCCLLRFNDPDTDLTTAARSRSAFYIPASSDSELVTKDILAVASIGTIRRATRANCLHAAAGSTLK